MSRTQIQRATLKDLYLAQGKAELVNGRIVPQMPTGRRPNRIVGRIFRSLDDHAERIGQGEAYTDNKGYIVPELSSGRQSFSPDTSYYVGPFPADPMRYIEGRPPTFAVEVRSANDYGEAAEAELAAKRADYFEAGTLVVWDVDPLAECINVYRATRPDRPDVYGRGSEAEAEPAVPGWKIAVDYVFSQLRK
jgi:Uma2 family endonuclease